MVVSDALGRSMVAMVPRGRIGLRAWNLASNEHPLFGQFEGYRPAEGPVTLPLLPVQRKTLNPLLHDLGGRPLPNVDVRFVTVAGDSRTIEVGPEAFDAVRVQSRSLRDGYVPPFSVPERFVLVEFRSRDIGRIVRPVETIGDKLQLPRLRRVRIDTGGRPIQAYWFLNKKGEVLEAIDRYGIETQRLYPLHGRPAIVRVPEDVVAVAFVRGGQIDRTRVRLSRRRDPEHVHRVKLK